jgi:hypothetical protein
VNLDKPPLVLFVHSEALGRLASMRGQELAELD